jgi:glycosyltransferase involved in cell wall biosynthesis
MDLVAEMITASLQRQGNVQAELIRPPMPQHFRKLLPGAGRNLDRLYGRFRAYAAFLRGIRSQFDVFHLVDHSYSQLVHVLPPERCLVTCHDLDTFRCLLKGPDGKALEARPWWFRKMTSRILEGLRKAAHIACVSQTTALALEQSGWVGAEKISVIPNGVSPEYFQETPPAAGAWLASWLKERGIEQKPLLLHVGSTIARKRIDVLLRVFAEVAAIAPEVELVRVGTEFTPEQRRLAEELGVAGHIHRAGKLDRGQLRALYERANLVLQPSEAEGFGLPVVEAQASGAVVVASDIPVLREVGGDAAFYLPVGDASGWSGKIQQLLQLQRTTSASWGTLQQKSRDNAARFRWEAVANSLSNRYQYLAGIMGGE